MKKKLLFFMMAFVACFTASSADQIVVADGEATNYYLPIKGTYCDTEGTYGYMIYPKEDLAEIAGTEISGFMFHFQTTMSASNAGCVLQLSLKEVDDATVESSSTTYSDLTVCGTYQIVGGETTMPFAFTQNFPYSGEKNLLVEVKVITASASYADFYTLGIRQTAGVNSSLSHYGTYSTLQNFLPKATIEYIGEAVDWDAKVSPETLDFGKIYTGEQATLNISIKNRGLNAFTPTFTVDAPFSVNWDTEIASGETVEVPVVFNPETDGVYNNNLAVTCGEAGTFNVSLKGTSIEAGSEIVVCEGTNQNGYIPVYGSYYDTQGTTSQFIYPAEMLTQLQGRAITSVKFFSNSTILFKGGKLQLSAKEVDYTTFDRETATSVPSNAVTDMKVVATIVPTGKDSELEFVFDEPFVYNGGNLAFETYVVEKNNYATTTWLGMNQTNDCAFYVYTSSWGDTSSNLAKFLPKMLMTTVAAGEQPVEEGKVITFTAEQENGTVAVALEDSTAVESNVTKVKEGEKFTVTATPAEGYEVENFEVKAGETVLNPVNAEGETMLKAEAPVAGTYEMPAEDVTITVTFKKKSPTAIESINTSNVKSVRYYNAAGVESATPFQGVNIVVREMTDGSKTTTKIVK